MKKNIIFLYLILSSLNYFYASEVGKTTFKEIDITSSNGIKTNNSFITCSNVDKHYVVIIANDTNDNILYFQPTILDWLKLLTNIKGAYELIEYSIDNSYDEDLLETTLKKKTNYSYSANFQFDKNTRYKGAQSFSYSYNYKKEIFTLYLTEFMSTENENIKHPYKKLYLTKDQFKDFTNMIIKITNEISNRSDFLPEI